MATFLVPSGPEGLHLFVVMNKACDTHQHLLLSITSIKEKIRYDPTCIFKGGEHRFITKPSYVLYRAPELRPTTHIIKCVESGVFNLREDIGQEHFKRMCDGIAKSDFTRPWVEDYARKVGIL